MQNNYLAEEVVALSKVNLIRESALINNYMEVKVDWVGCGPQTPEEISLRDRPNYS